MNFLPRFLIFLSLMIATNIYAVEKLPANLIDFASQPSTVMTKNSLNVNLQKLLSHFVTQTTETYCGIASVVMILNSSSLPQPGDSLHPPYRYFNQEDFFNNAVLKIITIDDVQKHGMTLNQLNEVTQAYGLKTQLFHANDITQEKLRKILRTAIKNQQFVIINFLRSALGQEGGGHHSPLAAYDEKTDRFLMLDVARYKYPAYWVKTQDLWKAINTLDGLTYRGFIIVT